MRRTELVAELRDVAARLTRGPLGSSPLDPHDQRMAAMGAAGILRLLLVLLEDGTGTPQEAIQFTVAVLRRELAVGPVAEPIA